MRPVKVIFQTLDDKIEFMSSLNKLSRVEDRFKALSITNDLTQSEREENRKLVEKAKQMTEEEETGEFVFKVRGPQWDRHIVKLKQQ